MTTCSKFSTDLALLAGGDLLPPTRAAAVESHAGSCEPCKAELAELRSALHLLEGARSVAMAQAATSAARASVVVDVIALLAAEGDGGSAARASAGTATHGRLSRLQRFLSAAAVLVVAAGAFALSHALTARQSGPVGVTSQIRAAADDGLPVRVSRSTSGDVELSWKDDGRSKGGPVARPYEVLASSSPLFTDARPIEVAGSHLVATMDFPAQVAGDRKVTFFRIQ